MIGLANALICVVMGAHSATSSTRISSLPRSSITFIGGVVKSDIGLEAGLDLRDLMLDVVNFRIRSVEGIDVVAVMQEVLHLEFVAVIYRAFQFLFESVNGFREIQSLCFECLFAILSHVLKSIQCSVRVSS
jgi:hypothetical protein